MTFKFREFDVVKIKKIHSNIIFLYLEKGMDTVNLRDENIIKQRPAIIIKQIDSIYLVLPLTTKPIKNSAAHLLLRSPFINKNLNKEGQNSYLMFDSLLRLQKYQIDGLYLGAGKKSISLSSDTKK